MRENKHHMFSTKKEFERTKSGLHLRRMGAYIIPMNIEWHRELHANTRHLKLPPKGTISSLIDIGNEYSTWNHAPTRINAMIDDMATIAIQEQSPERADHMYRVMGSFAAQLGIIELAEGLR